MKSTKQYFSGVRNRYSCFTYLKKLERSSKQKDIVSTILQHNFNKNYLYIFKDIYPIFMVMRNIIFNFCITYLSHEIIHMDQTAFQPSFQRKSRALTQGTILELFNKPNITLFEDYNIASVGTKHRHQEKLARLLSLYYAQASNGIKQISTTVRIKVDANDNVLDFDGSKICFGCYYALTLTFSPTTTWDSFYCRAEVIGSPCPLSCHVEGSHPFARNIAKVLLPNCLSNAYFENSIDFLIDMDSPSISSVEYQIDVVLTVERGSKEVLSQNLRAYTMMTNEEEVMQKSYIHSLNMYGSSILNSGVYKSLKSRAHDDRITYEYISPVIEANWVPSSSQNASQIALVQSPSKYILSVIKAREIFSEASGETNSFQLTPEIEVDINDYNSLSDSELDNKVRERIQKRINDDNINPFDNLNYRSLSSNNNQLESTKLFNLFKRNRRLSNTTSSNLEFRKICSKYNNIADLANKVPKSFIKNWALGVKELFWEYPINTALLVKDISINLYNSDGIFDTRSKSTVLYSSKVSKSTSKNAQLALTAISPQSPLQITVLGVLQSNTKMAIIIQVKLKHLIRDVTLDFLFGQPCQLIQPIILNADTLKLDGYSDIVSFNNKYISFRVSYARHRPGPFYIYTKDLNSNYFYRPGNTGMATVYKHWRWSSIINENIDYDGEISYPLEGVVDGGIFNNQDNADDYQHKVQYKKLNLDNLRNSQWLVGECSVTFNSVYPPESNLYAVVEIDKYNLSLHNTSNMELFADYSLELRQPAGKNSIIIPPQMILRSMKSFPTLFVIPEFSETELTLHLSMYLGNTAREAIGVLVYAEENDLNFCSTFSTYGDIHIDSCSLFDISLSELKNNGKLYDWGNIEVELEMKAYNAWKEFQSSSDLPNRSQYIAPFTSTSTNPLSTAIFRLATPLPLNEIKGMLKLSFTKTLQIFIIDRNGQCLARQWLRAGESFKIGQVKPIKVEYTNNKLTLINSPKGWLEFPYFKGSLARKTFDHSGRIFHAIESEELTEELINNIEEEDWRGDFGIHIPRDKQPRPFIVRYEVPCDGCDLILPEGEVLPQTVPKYLNVMTESGEHIAAIYKTEKIWLDPYFETGILNAGTIGIRILVTLAAESGEFDITNGYIKETSVCAKKMGIGYLENNIKYSELNLISRNKVKVIRGDNSKICLFLEIETEANDHVFVLFNDESYKISISFIPLQIHTAWLSPVVRYHSSRIEINISNLVQLIPAHSIKESLVHNLLIKLFGPTGLEWHPDCIIELNYKNSEGYSCLIQESILSILVVNYKRNNSITVSIPISSVMDVNINDRILLKLFFGDGTKSSSWLMPINFVEENEMNMSFFSYTAEVHNKARFLLEVPEGGIDSYTLCSPRSIIPVVFSYKGCKSLLLKKLSKNDRDIEQEMDSIENIITYKSCVIDENYCQWIVFNEVQLETFNILLETYIVPHSDYWFETDENQLKNELQSTEQVSFLWSSLYILKERPSKMAYKFSVIPTLMTLSVVMTVTALDTEEEMRMRLNSLYSTPNKEKSTTHNEYYNGFTHSFHLDIDFGREVPIGTRLIIIPSNNVSLNNSKEMLPIFILSDKVKLKEYEKSLYDNSALIDFETLVPVATLELVIYLDINIWEVIPKDAMWRIQQCSSAHGEFFQELKLKNDGIIPTLWSSAANVMKTSQCAATKEGLVSIRIENHAIYEQITNTHIDKYGGIGLAYYFETAQENYISDNAKYIWISFGADIIPNPLNILHYNGTSTMINWFDIIILIGEVDSTDNRDLKNNISNQERDDVRILESTVSNIKNNGSSNFRNLYTFEYEGDTEDLNIGDEESKYTYELSNYTGFCNPVGQFQSSAVFKCNYIPKSKKLTFQMIRLKSKDYRISTIQIALFNKFYIEIFRSKLLPYTLPKASTFGTIYMMSLATMVDSPIVETMMYKSPLSSRSPHALCSKISLSSTFEVGTIVSFAINTSPLKSPMSSILMQLYEDSVSIAGKLNNLHDLYWSLIQEYQSIYVPRGILEPLAITNSALLGRIKTKIEKNQKLIACAIVITPPQLNENIHSFSLGFESWRISSNSLTDEVIRERLSKVDCYVIDKVQNILIRNELMKNSKSNITKSYKLALYNKKPLKRSKFPISKNIRNRKRFKYKKCGYFCNITKTFKYNMLKIKSIILPSSNNILNSEKTLVNNKQKYQETNNLFNSSYTKKNRLDIEDNIPVRNLKRNIYISPKMTKQYIEEKYIDLSKIKSNEDFFNNINYILNNRSIKEQRYSKEKNSIQSEDEKYIDGEQRISSILSITALENKNRIKNNEDQQSINNTNTKNIMYNDRWEKTNIIQLAKKTTNFFIRCHNNETIDNCHRDFFFKKSYIDLINNSNLIFKSNNYQTNKLIFSRIINCQDMNTNDINENMSKIPIISNIFLERLFFFKLLYSQNGLTYNNKQQYILKITDFNYPKLIYNFCNKNNSKNIPILNIYIFPLKYILKVIYPTINQENNSIQILLKTRHIISLNKTSKILKISNINNELHSFSERSYSRVNKVKFPARINFELINLTEILNSIRQITPFAFYNKDKLRKNTIYNDSNRDFFSKINEIKRYNKYIKYIVLQLKNLIILKGLKYNEFILGNCKVCLNNVYNHSTTIRYFDNNKNSIRRKLDLLDKSNEETESQDFFDNSESSITARETIKLLRSTEKLYAKDLELLPISWGNSESSEKVTHDIKISHLSSQSSDLSVSYVAIVIEAAHHLIPVVIVVFPGYSVPIRCSAKDTSQSCIPIRKVIIHDVLCNAIAIITEKYENIDGLTQLDDISVTHVKYEVDVWMHSPMYHLAYRSSILAFVPYQVDSAFLTKPFDTKLYAWGFGSDAWTPINFKPIYVSLQNTNTQGLLVIIFIIDRILENASVRIIPPVCLRPDLTGSKSSEVQDIKISSCVIPSCVTHPTKIKSGVPNQELIDTTCKLYSSQTYKESIEYDLEDYRAEDGVRKLFQADQFTIDLGQNLPPGSYAIGIDIVILSSWIHPKGENNSKFHILIEDNITGEAAAGGTKISTGSKSATNTISDISLSYKKKETFDSLESIIIKNTNIEETPIVLGDTALQQIQWKHMSNEVKSISVNLPPFLDHMLEYSKLNVNLRYLLNNSWEALEYDIIFEVSNRFQISGSFPSGQYLLTMVVKTPMFISFTNVNIITLCKITECWADFEYRNPNTITVFPVWGFPMKRPDSVFNSRIGIYDFGEIKERPWVWENY